MERQTLCTGKGTIYAMIDKYEGLRFGVRFYFHATDQADAERKATAWNRYHGYCDSPGWGWHIPVPATDTAEATVRDEWIPRHAR